MYTALPLLAEHSGGGADEGEGDSTQHTVSGCSVACTEVWGAPAANMASHCATSSLSVVLCRCRGLLVYSVMSSFRPEYIASR